MSRAEAGELRDVALDALGVDLAQHRAQRGRRPVGMVAGRARLGGRRGGRRDGDGGADGQDEPGGQRHATDLGHGPSSGWLPVPYPRRARRILRVLDIAHGRQRRPRRRHRDDQRQGGRLRRRRPRAGPRRDGLPAARARARPGGAGSRRRGRRHARGDPRRRGRRARRGRADRGAVVQRRHALARRPRRRRARRSRRSSRGPTCGRPSRPSACAPSTPSCTTATGTPLHPMAPLPKLVWFAEHEPETFAAVRALGRDQGARGRAG